MVASFLLSINLIDMSEVRARTVATTVLVAVGLYLIIVLEASSKMRGYTVGALCAVLFALYLVVLSLPGWRDFFEVAAPDPAIILVSLVGTALAVTGLALTDERFLPIPGRTPARAARTAVRISASVIRTALVTHQAQIASIRTSSA